MTPLLPATYDLAWSVVALLGLVLTVVSLVRWRDRWRSGLRSGASAAAWLLVILLLPWLGAAVHLAVTPRPEAVGDDGS